MKNILLILLACLLFRGNAGAQGKMIVNMQSCGLIRFGDCNELLNSISELPPKIQFKIDRFLQNKFADKCINLEYSLGEVTDAKRCFPNKPNVPKYQFCFYFNDTTIGIKRYNFELRLDENGEAIFSNWPIDDYSNKAILKPRYEIEEFALHEARLRKFDTDNYIVDFDYNKENNMLCWIFNFKIKNEENKYDVLEIDWVTKVIVDEYILFKAPIVY